MEFVLHCESPNNFTCIISFVYINLTLFLLPFVLLWCALKILMLICGGDSKSSCIKSFKRQMWTMALDISDRLYDALLAIKQKISILIYSDDRSNAAKVNRRIAYKETRRRRNEA